MVDVEVMLGVRVDEGTVPSSLRGNATLDQAEAHNYFITPANCFITSPNVKQSVGQVYNFSCSQAS